jgi:hypothetical protein
MFENPRLRLDLAPGGIPLSRLMEGGGSDSMSAGAQAVKESKQHTRLTAANVALKHQQLEQKRHRALQAAQTRKNHAKLLNAPASSADSADDVVDWGSDEEGNPSTALDATARSPSASNSTTSRGKAKAKAKAKPMVSSVPNQFAGY